MKVLVKAIAEHIKNFRPANKNDEDVLYPTMLNILGREGITLPSVGETYKDDQTGIEMVKVGKVHLMADDFEIEGNMIVIAFFSDV